MLGLIIVMGLTAGVLSAADDGAADDDDALYDGIVLVYEQHATAAEIAAAERLPSIEVHAQKTSR